MIYVLLYYPELSRIKHRLYRYLTIRLYLQRQDSEEKRGPFKFINSVRNTWKASHSVHM